MATKQPDSNYVTRAEFEGFKLELNQEMQSGISQLDDYYAARDRARDEITAEIKRDYERVFPIVEENRRMLYEHSRILARHDKMLLAIINHLGIDWE